MLSSLDVFASRQAEIEKTQMIHNADNSRINTSKNIYPD
jgi:hypothetical protein